MGLSGFVLPGWDESSTSKEHRMLKHDSCWFGNPLPGPQDSQTKQDFVILATMVYQKSYWIASQGPEINVPEAEFYWKQRILAMGFAWFCLLAEYAPLIF